jgi:phage repressor protein C with HTH and peptisase S24 domain
MRYALYMSRNLGKWLVKALQHGGVTQADLARELTTRLGRSIDRAAVNKMTKNLRLITADELLIASEVTGYPAPTGSKRPQTTQALGYVGAGSEIVPIDDHAQGAGLEEVELPPGVPEDSALVIVRGDSMYPRYYDNEYLFYKEYEGNVVDLVGRECVVQLEDGRTFVKTLRKGQQGLFNLESFNAPTLENQAVKRAGPVIARVNRGAGR